jgi:hypothetical protein
VYSEDTRQSIGAITSDFIEGSREAPNVFATALIFAENVVYEYHQPAYVEELPRISISNIGYAYRNVNNLIPGGFGDAWHCQVNVNCPEGDNWQAEKNAATGISIPKQCPFEGTVSFSWCSGALINNTANDFTPYVLTAEHCMWHLGMPENTLYDAVSNPDASQWIFYWGYEHPGCNNNILPPQSTTTVGATVIANNLITDFALVRLSSLGDPRYISGLALYYLGWDRTGNPGTGGVGIHHPGGDVKKVSTYTMTPQSIRRSNPNVIDPNGSHWKITWAPTTHNNITRHGIIQGGSSGSPLINNNRKVIGQLDGGVYGLSCSAPTLPVWYGKFSVSWVGGSPQRSLKDWLDPLGTGDYILDGCTGAIINQTVSISRTIRACSGSMDIGNVTITNNAILTIIAPDGVNFVGDVNIESGDLVIQ